MPILHTAIIFPNVANDDETFFFLHYNSKPLFYKFYSTQIYVSVIFSYKLTNFTDFYDKLFKNLHDCNFTLSLIKKNDVKLQ